MHSKQMAASVLRGRAFHQLSIPCRYESPGATTSPASAELVLTINEHSANTPAVNRPGFFRSSAPPVVLLGAACLSFSLVGVAIAATPYSSATVTKVENRVAYGEQNSKVTRPAAVRDVVRENNFLLSQKASRAELEYPDGSVVRIGQNTVFSFDSDTRTLSLTKGSLLFYVPKGSGGGKIKTPSLTAAITGTAGKVSENYIAIVEGVVRLEPSGRLVREGEFARRNADGTITIGRFDPATATAGQLVNFNGVMPGFQERELAGLGRDLPFPDLRQFEVLQRTQNLPSAIEQHFPPPPDPKPPEADRPRRQVVVPPPRNDPAPRPRPGNGGEY